jgi:hypothetical protein
MPSSTRSSAAVSLEPSPSSTEPSSDGAHSRALGTRLDPNARIDFVVTPWSGNLDWIKQLQDAEGVRLGKIVNVVSSSTNSPMPYMMSAQKAGDTEAATNITPGENKVNIGVTIYYETY